jgi:DNA-directed RNA polymerase subunit beta
MAEIFPKGVELRDFDDLAKTRSAIFDRTRQATLALPPVTNKKYTLKLHSADYQGPEQFSLADENRALLEGRSLGRRLVGTWHLVDNATQQPVDQRKMTLATVPYLTSMGTFINNGTDYGISSQFRLRPGIFAREKESGELESHVNVAKGFGHRYFLDPASGIFRIQVGQARMPLLPLLKTLGASDDTIRQRWGNELWAANTKRQDPTVLKKLYQKIYAGRETPAESGVLQDAIRKAFGDIELDPEVTQQTLGKPHTKLTHEAILDAVDKLVKLHRGEAELDDRDALQYQKVLTPEDLFADRIRAARKQLAQTLWKLTNDNSLKRMPAGAFDRAVRGVLLETGLASSLEETNPAEILDRRFRITRMGEGGIPSNDSVPEAARNVHPSQLGFVDPVVTPESNSVGVDLRIAVNTKKGSDGRLYSRFTNSQTGDTEWKAPQDLADKVVAFPRELQSGEPYVRAVAKGKLQYVPRKSVDYELGHMTEGFSPLANLVPMKAAAKGNRPSMAARMITQAVALANAEAPHVQAGVPGTDRSFEELYGQHMGAVQATGGGTVLAVKPEQILVRGNDGQTQIYPLHNRRLFNRKSYLHNTPTVQVGQQIQPGQLLAQSNYTDANGTTSLGMNARVGYIPTGTNYEDAIVISDSFAKRLTSEHAYQHTLDKADNRHLSKNKFVSLFPSTYDRHMLAKFDDDGTIKPGTQVNYQDPLILAVEETAAGPRLGRRKSAFRDSAVLWEQHQPGEVTHVVKGDQGINVVVRALQPTQLADKLSARIGDKGIISEIKPDHLMPHDEEGRPLEVLMNPHGVISRGNPTQVMEAALGKIAAKTGKPYKVTDFDDIEDLRQYAEDELKKHGMKLYETVTDPATGNKIPNVLVGNRYIMKLHHMSESKAQGRSTGGYSSAGEPTKGGEDSAKRVGLLNLNAILSHGAYSLARDVGVVRGQRNEDYWRQFMSGHTPPQPQVPFVYEKFLNELRGSGINPLQTGSRINLMAMTDKDIDKLAGDRELQNAETVDWHVDRLTPKPGGLFDQTLTGGHGNKNRWSFVRLREPFPNPVMEDPIKKVLGLTQQQYEDVLAGKAVPTGKGVVPASPGSVSGPAALHDALKNINLDREIARASLEIRGTRKTARDAAIKRQAFLKGAKETGVHPADWMVTKVPVLPPAFRPVSLLKESGIPIVSDSNYLYRDLFDANQLLKEMHGKLDDVGEERLAVYNAFKAVTGLGEPIQKQTQEQGVRGFLKSIIGSSPKFGTVQRRLLGSTVDLVGRATISPNPNLDMDEVGVPEEEAWTLYKPFIVRRLVRRGMGHLDAVDAAENQDKQAKEALLAEMKERPMVVDRAPVLHKFGVMGFRPVLVQGKALQLPPLVYKGFGADNDGDAMQFQVVQDKDASQEVLDKMLPSRNLFSAGDFKVQPVPTQEYISGLYTASTARSDKPVKTFRSVRDVREAFDRGEIGIGDPVKVLEHA